MTLPDAPVVPGLPCASCSLLRSPSKPPIQGSCSTTLLANKVRRPYLCSLRNKLCGSRRNHGQCTEAGALRPYTCTSDGTHHRFVPTAMSIGGSSLRSQPTTPACPLILSQSAEYTTERGNVFINLSVPACRFTPTRLVRLQTPQGRCGGSSLAVRIQRAL